MQPDVLKLPRGAGRFLVAFTFVGSCIGLLWAFVTPQGQFFLFGMLACLVVSLPLVRKDYALLGPWSIFALTAYVSCGVRGLFISLGLNGRVSLDQLFLLGHAPGYFTRTSALYVVAIALVALGYMWRPRSTPGRMARRYANFELPRMLGVAVAVLALIGLVAFALYVQRTGGLAGGLSTKRTTINGLDLSNTYRSHGELRFLNRASAVALWLHVAQQATLRRPGAYPRLKTVALMLNAALLPVYASSRSEVAYIVLVALAIHWGVGHRRPPARQVVTLAVVGLTVLATMTGLRAVTQGNQQLGTTKSEVAIDTVGSVLVYNRNFGDMQTTTHIIKAVPTVLPYQYGKTIAIWLLAPIPRAIWHEKPILHSGPVIGLTLYGNNRAGVPPGFVAEMYWNFALPGVLFGSLLLGLLLAYIRDAFVPYLRGRPVVTLIYAVALARLGTYMFYGGVGTGAVQVLIDAVWLFPALVLTSMLRDPPTSRTGRVGHGPHPRVRV
jgi:hypothetical protein